MKGYGGSAPKYTYRELKEARFAPKEELTAQDVVRDIMNKLRNI
jgi:hypothetical protein